MPADNAALLRLCKKACRAGLKSNTGASSFSPTLNDCSAIQPGALTPANTKLREINRVLEGRLGALQYVQIVRGKTQCSLRSDFRMQCPGGTADT